jgi:hypothetical protein
VYSRETGRGNSREGGGTAAAALASASEKVMLPAPHTPPAPERSVCRQERKILSMTTIRNNGHNLMQSNSGGSRAGKKARSNAPALAVHSSRKTASRRARNSSENAPSTVYAPAPGCSDSGGISARRCPDSGGISAPRPPYTGRGLGSAASGGGGGGGGATPEAARAARSGSEAEGINTASAARSARWRGRGLCAASSTAASAASRRAAASARGDDDAGAVEGRMGGRPTEAPAQKSRQQTCRGAARLRRRRRPHGQGSNGKKRNGRGT